MSAAEFLTPAGDPQVQGREATRAFLVTLRTVRTHGWKNEASLGAVEAVGRILNEVYADRGDFGLHAVGENVFLDDTRLKSDATGFGVFENFVTEINRRAVGSILVAGNLTRKDVTVLVDLLLRVDEAQATADPVTVLHALNDALERAGAPLSVGGVRSGEVMITETDSSDRKERAKKAFFKAVTVARAVLTSAHLNKRLNLRHAKRVVQNMVDLIMEEEFSLMGLTTLKDYDNYTFYHSVNVCIYSLALGKRLGMDRAQLCELGVAAMMHDMGKTKVPVEILRKQGRFTKEELDVMKRHPEMGVRELLRMKGLSSLAFKSMVAAFEHHLNFDPRLAGYPEVRKPFKPHVIGRIVAIADCFDAMTTKRCYTPRAMTRDKALAFMISQAGQKFDPVLVRIFANLVGVFPVGTTVRLKSGRIAVVTASAEDPSLCHLPKVKPVTNSQGIEGDFPEVELSVPGPDGQYPDEILVAVDEEDLGFDTSKYFR